MSADDRRRWDERYAAVDLAAGVGAPRLFAPHEHLFPTAGHALELACGDGRAAVWMAARGLDVVACDVSPVAIARARARATAHGVTDHCRFAVVDLDEGLPDGPPADVIVCHLFRDPALDAAIVERLAPGGLLAVAALSEVGAAPGSFRVAPGVLRRAFAALDVVADGEGDGEAWLLATKAQ